MHICVTSRRFSELLPKHLVELLFGQTVFIRETTKKYYKPMCYLLCRVAESNAITITLHQMLGIVAVFLWSFDKIR